MNTFAKIVYFLLFITSVANGIYMLVTGHTMSLAGQVFDEFFIAWLSLIIFLNTGSGK